MSRSKKSPAPTRQRASVFGSVGLHSPSNTRQYLPASSGTFHVGSPDLPVALLGTRLDSFHAVKYLTWPSVRSPRNAVTAARYCATDGATSHEMSGPPWFAGSTTFLLSPQRSNDTVG